MWLVWKTTEISGSACRLGLTPMGFSKERDRPWVLGGLGVSLGPHVVSWAFAGYVGEHIKPTNDHLLSKDVLYQVRGNFVAMSLVQIIQDRSKEQRGTWWGNV
jgi:hypothetical protein